MLAILENSCRSELLGANRLAPIRPTGTLEFSSARRGSRTATTGEPAKYAGRTRAGFLGRLSALHRGQGLLKRKSKLC